MIRISSQPPHDFFLTLDVDEYFEAEDDPIEIAERGLVRGLNLSDRSVLAVIRYNQNPVEPVFEVELPEQDSPTKAEEAEIERLVGRIVGSKIDLTAFEAAVADDPVLGPIVEEHYGFKRLARSCFFEDAMRHIVRTRISHDPTRRRMVQDIRKAWGTGFEWQGRQYYSYPRPEVLAAVDPEDFRAFGISARKGEYVVGLAASIASGEIDQDALEKMSAEEFWEVVNGIRGIGPATAQALMFRRNRADSNFMAQRSTSSKNRGQEVGYRRWLFSIYGIDPHDPDAVTEEAYEKIRANWRGFEAPVWHYLFYHWLMESKAAEHG
ncbi:DNA-3-methyladenine glycosylase family protein [Bradymonas sediminis]|uniref:Uncharacterized protein n=1 Tax=Bradymonas sediminis TaxID=1548548 RepID=A0A2Z4FP97_9DELT|nr:hypothetical protein [Bradymonas sediminis]AWV90508.1 hypothetical protein DN745_14705 [Bradymonas sediminis]TDP72099.1 3-methyladenine DNA glycosylase/8-oxoguanine DNA glycosylase [Bradymonas sediminis]